MSPSPLGGEGLEQGTGWAELLYATTCSMRTDGWNTMVPSTGLPSVLAIGVTVRAVLVAVGRMKFSLGERTDVLGYRCWFADHCGLGIEPSPVKRSLRSCRNGIRHNRANANHFICSPFG